MRRWIISITTVLTGLLFPLGADATSPQVYVGSNPGYTVVFKAEENAVSVLGLDAPLYCSETEPSHRFGPGTISVFRRPTLMREGAGGLEALLGAGGGPSSEIEAAFDGTKLTGAFSFAFTEESFHCQTAGFYAARPEVPFEAVPYGPAGTVPTLPPVTGEVPIYYGNEGGTEVLLEPNPKSVVFRGAAPSSCPIEGKVGPEGPVSLFGDVIDTHREGEGFDRTIRRKGKTGNKSWSETRSVSGVVGEAEIAGFYERSTTIRPAGGPPRRCTGTLPFRALLYRPEAAGS